MNDSWERFFKSNFFCSILYEVTKRTSDVVVVVRHADERREVAVTSTRVRRSIDSWRSEVGSGGRIDALAIGTGFGFGLGLDWRHVSSIERADKTGSGV